MSFKKGDRVKYVGLPDADNSDTWNKYMIKVGMKGRITGIENDYVSNGIFVKWDEPNTDTKESWNGRCFKKIPNEVRKEVL